MARLFASFGGRFRPRRSAAATGPSGGCDAGGRRAGRGRWLRCEQLEDRRLLAVFMINSTTDVVDLSDDQTTLREAIFAANLVPGTDEIRFAPQLFASHTPTIVLRHGELKITDSLTISGPGRTLLAIDASGGDPTPNHNNGDCSRIFNVDDGDAATTATFILRGLSLVGADASQDGGALYSRENVIVEDCFFFRNSAGNGGAISSTGTLAVARSIFMENSAQYNGGAINLEFGRVVIDRCTISDNQAQRRGGGIFSRGGTLIVDSTISNNRSLGADGGGVFLSVYWASNHEATLIRCTVTGNSAAGSGGGIHGNAPYDSTRNVSRVDLLDSVVSGNSATTGGGLSVFGPVNFVVDGCTVADNSAKDGGGIGSHASESSIEVVNSIVTRNSASRNGGGIHSDYGSITILYSDILNNRAGSEGEQGRGGGVHSRLIGVAGDLTISSSTVAGNSATLSGGGVYGAGGRILVTNAVFKNNVVGTPDSMFVGGGGAALSGDVTVRGSAFISNSSTGWGGGIQIGGRAAISNSSFCDNSSRIGAGMYVSAGGTRRSAISIQDIIVAGNKATETGGGIHFEVKSPYDIVVARSTISGNTAGANGGGVYVHHLGNWWDQNSITLDRTTISGNAADNGGGLTIESFNPVSVSVLFSTIYGNTARSDSNAAGGLLVDSEQIPLLVDHSIIAGNRTTLDVNADFFRTGVGRFGKTSFTYSLLGDRGASGLPEAPIAAPDAYGNLIGGPLYGAIDPRLAPLADNGGTALPGGLALLTHAPLSGSPVVDAGDPQLLPGAGGAPEFDQRGAPFTRLAGAQVDIGAVEWQSAGGALQADFNLDGVTDGADFLAWQRGVGQVPATIRQGDATADGDVDHYDLEVWQSRLRMAPVDASTTEGAMVAAMTADAQWFAPTAEGITLAAAVHESAAPATGVAGNSADRTSRDAAIVELTSTARRAALAAAPALPSDSRAQRNAPRDGGENDASEATRYGDSPLEALLDSAFQQSATATTGVERWRSAESH